MFVCFVVVIQFFRDRIGCLGTCSIDQVGLDMPSHWPASWILIFNDDFCCLEKTDFVVG